MSPFGKREEGTRGGDKKMDSRSVDPFGSTLHKQACVPAVDREAKKGGGRWWQCCALVSFERNCRVDLFSTRVQAKLMRKSTQSGLLTRCFPVPEEKPVPEDRWNSFTGSRAPVW